MLEEDDISEEWKPPPNEAEYAGEIQWSTSPVASSYSRSLLFLPGLFCWSSFSLTACYALFPCFVLPSCGFLIFGAVGLGDYHRMLLLSPRCVLKANSLGRSTRDGEKSRTCKCLLAIFARMRQQQMRLSSNPARVLSTDLVFLHVNNRRGRCNAGETGEKTSGEITKSNADRGYCRVECNAGEGKVVLRTSELEVRKLSEG